MIRLSKLTDYAFVLLTQIVSSNQTSWSAADLSERTTLPLPTVAKIMKLLAKGGIVMAQRGAAGGYRLAQPATQTTVASIIEAVDGPIALTGCVDKHQPCCAVKSFCAMRGGWDKLNKAMHTALSSVTLEDLSHPAAMPQLPPVAEKIVAEKKSEIFA